MDKLGRNIKENPLAWGVGAVIAAVGAYMAYDWMRTRQNAAIVANRKKAVVQKAIRNPQTQQPRGKLPWAIGDVNLWDDEDESYCRKCSNTCKSTDNTDLCIKCRERCPMN